MLIRGPFDLILYLSEGRKKLVTKLKITKDYKSNLYNHINSKVGIKASIMWI